MLHKCIIFNSTCYILIFRNCCGITRNILAGGTDNKNDGGGFVLHSTERLVINVTTAQAGSTIDYTVSYYDMGFGTVWSQS